MVAVEIVFSIAMAAASRAMHPSHG
jgi:hypothetical protein